ncbi:hypothetical protein OQA88_9675 [Cercophora sp. LCS_1]
MAESGSIPPPPLNFPRGGEPPQARPGNKWTPWEDVFGYTVVAFALDLWRKGDRTFMPDEWQGRKDEILAFRLPKISPTGDTKRLIFEGMNPFPYWPPDHPPEAPPNWLAIPRLRDWTPSEEGKGRDVFEFEVIPKAMKEPEMAALDIKFVKILGFGGLGFAALFEVEPDVPGESKRKVVLKMAREREGGYVHNQESEWSAHVRTAGAQHVVQRVLMKASEAIWKETDRQTARAKADELKHKLLWIEFMERGRLGDYLVTYSQMEERFTDITMAMIFECFLVGDFEEEGEADHDVVPILKIADLGLSRHLHASETDINGPKAYWRARMMGKSSLYTPEQFTDEWDYLDVSHYHGAMPHYNDTKIAGHYDYPTNTYQMGLLMFQWLTKHHPERIPVPSLWPSWFFDDMVPRSENVWTYGGALNYMRSMNPSWGGTRNDYLINLASRALAAEPHQRPDRGEMYRVMEMFRQYAETDPRPPAYEEAKREARELFSGMKIPEKKPVNPVTEAASAGLGTMNDDVLNQTARLAAATPMDDVTYYAGETGDV